MKPNLYHMKYLVDAVQQGSLQRAAETNLVSQSAITQGIQNLERSFKIKILDHGKNRFRLTPQGEIALVRFREILKSLDEIESDLRSRDDEITGSLRIACSRSLAGSFLGPFVASFSEKAPRVKISIRIGKTTEIRRWIIDGVVDCGIALKSEAESSLNSFPLASGKFVCVIRKDISNKSHELPYILTEPRVETEKIKRIYKRENGKEITVLAEVESWAVILELAAQGLGIAVVPDILLECDTRIWSVMDSTSDSPKYRIHLLSAKSKNQSKALDLFLKLAKAKS